jgi:hypothetical protein
MMLCSWLRAGARNVDPWRFAARRYMNLDGLPSHIPDRRELSGFAYLLSGSPWIRPWVERMRSTGDQGWSPRACAEHGLRSAMLRAKLSALLPRRFAATLRCPCFACGPAATSCRGVRRIRLTLPRCGPGRTVSLRRDAPASLPRCGPASTSVYWRSSHATHPAPLTGQPRLPVWALVTVLLAHVRSFAACGSPCIAQKARDLPSWQIPLDVYVSPNK